MNIPFWPKVLFQQYKTHQNADLPIDNYIDTYKEKLRKIVIGSSFAPELLDQIYERKHHSKIDHKQKLEILKIMVEEFKIRDLRLGIRWNECVDKNGKFDFSYYLPYIDYCLKKRLRVCLNVGPIKTFGWPEEHIPDSTIKKLPTDFYKYTVLSKSSLASDALDFLENLLYFLTTTYSPKQLEILVIIQPENEAFNRFGTYRLRLSDEYVKEVIQKVNNYFPDKKILLNSAQTWQTEKIGKLFLQLDQKNALKKENICGVNYYYNLPHLPNLGKIGPVDFVTISNLVGWRTAEQNIQRSRTIGYDIEVTEAQVEQWGNQIFSPGNSLHEFKYLLGRCMDNLLDPQSGGVIRLWGLERLAQKRYIDDLDREHREIIQLIQTVNNANR